MAIVIVLLTAESRYSRAIVVTMRAGLLLTAESHSSRASVVAGVRSLESTLLSVMPHLTCLLSVVARGLRRQCFVRVIRVRYCES